jgi:hypothetical protein
VLRRLSLRRHRIRGMLASPRQPPSGMIRFVGQKEKKLTFSIMAQLTVQKTASLMTLARKGPFRARDLAAASIPRTYLKRLCERGSLEKIGRGLYRLSDSPVTELSSLAEVAKRVPHCVICLLSALQLHGLTTEVPHAVWLLIDRRARMPKLDQPALEVVRASGAAREHGIATRKIDGCVCRSRRPQRRSPIAFGFDGTSASTSRSRR